MEEKKLDEFINNFDKEMNKPGLKIEKDKFSGNFTDMRIADIGYGKSEYKTSKPNILKNDAVVDEIQKVHPGHGPGALADRDVNLWPALCFDHHSNKLVVYNQLIRKYLLKLYIL